MNPNNSEHALGKMNDGFQDLLDTILMRWDDYYSILMWLFVAVATIQLAMIFLGYATTGKSPVEPMSMLIKLAFWWLLAFSFPQVMNVVKWTALRLGAMGSGGVIITSPSDVLVQGWELASDVLGSLTKNNSISYEDTPPGFKMDQAIQYALVVTTRAVLGLVVFLGIVVCYLMIMVQVYLAFTEFAILTAMGAILLPFGALKQTSHIAEKLVQSVIGHAIKLLLIQFIIGLGGTIMQGADEYISKGSNLYGDISETAFAATFSLFLLLGRAFIFATLVKAVPAMASGFLSGQPSLTGQNAAQTALAAGMAARMGARAVKTGAAIASGGTTAITSAAGGVMKGIGAAKSASQAFSQKNGPGHVGGLAAGAGAFGKSVAGSIGKGIKKKGQEVWRDMQNPAKSMRRHGGRVGNAEAQNSTGAANYMGTAFKSGYANEQGNAQKRDEKQTLASQAAGHIRAQKDIKKHGQQIFRRQSEWKPPVDINPKDE